MVPRALAISAKGIVDFYRTKGLITSRQALAFVPSVVVVAERQRNHLNISIGGSRREAFIITVDRAEIFDVFSVIQGARSGGVQAQAVGSFTEIEVEFERNVSGLPRCATDGQQPCLTDQQRNALLADQETIKQLVSSTVAALEDCAIHAASAARECELIGLQKGSRQPGFIALSAEARSKYKHAFEILYPPLTTAVASSREETQSGFFRDIPGLALFVPVANRADLAITLSADTEPLQGARIFVRALVAGEAVSPDDVLFATGDSRGTRSFTFIKRDVAKGIHHVRVQWLVDRGVGTGVLAARTLAVESLPDDRGEGVLIVEAAPSGPDQATNQPTFTDIPGLTADFSTPAEGALAITFSAEAETLFGGRMFVRALVDEQATDPDDVLFAREGFVGTRSFTFIKRRLGAGAHRVRIQWGVEPAGTALIGDRTLKVVALPESLEGGLSAIAARSGLDRQTTFNTFEDIPELSVSFTSAADSSVVITLSGEAHTSAGSSMLVRSLLDDVPAEPADQGEVILEAGEATGARSFTFVRRDLPAGDHRVRMQWAVEPTGTAFIGDRTLTVLYLNR